jgi:hypothetical protein
VYLAGTVAIAPQNTEMLISYDTEAYDSGTVWTVANPSRLIAPSTGYYQVHAGISFNGNSDSATRQIRVRKNAGGSAAGGSAVALASCAPIPTAALTHLRTQAIVQMTAGDYLEVFVLQNSSASLASNSITQQMAFSLTKIAS